MTIGSDNLFPKVKYDNQTSDASAPVTDDWTTYAKAGGIYARSSNAIVGPFATSDFSATTLRVPVGTGNVPYTEGSIGWQSTNEQLRLFDGQRERIIGDSGWSPMALPLGWVYNVAFTTSETLPISGGSIAVPIFVPSHMMSRGFTIRNLDTTNTRAIEARLYQQRLNAGNTAENTLDFVTGTDASDSFTAAAASTRAIVFSGAPVYLAPGIYWIVVRNTSGTQTWALGSTANGGNFNINTAQTKTIGSSLGSTLDMVAATWTKVTAIYAVRLVGNVFGQLSSF